MFKPWRTLISILYLYVRPVLDFLNCMRIFLLRNSRTDTNLASQVGPTTDFEVLERCCKHYMMLRLEPFDLLYKINIKKIFKITT
jgi:hypothetical protein